MRVGSWGRLVGATALVGVSGVVSVAQAPSASAAVIEPFTAEYDDRVWGDYLLVGNSQLECIEASTADVRDLDGDADTAEALAPLVGWNYATQCANDADRDTVSGGEANDERFMVFTTTDNVNSGIFNSSDVTLTLPPGSRIDVARLYWHGNDVLASGTASDATLLNAADTAVGDGTPGASPWPTCQASFVGKNYTTYGNYSGTASAATVTNRMRAAYRGAHAGVQNQMKLMVHTGAYDTSYSTITAADSDISPNASLSGHLYQQEADVTALIDAAPRNTPITITGANISTGEGFGCTGAWSLGIVYSYASANPTYAPDLRRIQIYDGFAEAADNESADVELGGFLASGGGAVEPRFGMVAYEGDQQITGDGLDIESWTQNEPRLTPTNTVTNNYATSTIGEFTTATATDFTRSPNHNDAAGADIKVVPFDINSLTGANDGVTVNFSTTGDRYTPGVVIFSALEANVTGKVFADSDSDGTRDAGEPGISGVTLTLTGTTAASGSINRTTTTDSDGNYVFDSVPDADGSGYTITETQPTAYLDGVELVGTADGADGTANDPNVISGIGHTNVAQSTGYEFGELVPDPQMTAAVSVYAGHDNGVSCPGGASVTGLLPGDPYTVCVAVDNTSADASHLDGISFTGLSGTPTKKTGTLPIAPAAGAVYYLESAAPGTSPTTLTPSVTANPVTAAGADLTTRPDATASAGSASVVLLPSVAIGNKVFDDLDADGIQDGGEPGLSGATVTLYDAANTTAVATDAFGGTVNPIITGVGGTYTFSGITPGQYTVRVSPPAGYVATLTDQGGDDTADSDGPAGQTPALAADANYTALDAGFVATTASIAGNVWSDQDYDTVADPGEPGISSVTVTLTGTDFTGTPVGPTTTATVGGNFSFTSLAPGTYAITETQPTNYATGTTRNGSPAATTNTNTVTGIVIGSGTGANGYGFADDPGIINGIVFDDLDGDGTLDGGEPGIANVQLDLDGTPFTTSAGGLFAFPGLLPGTYALSETQPAGYLDGVEILGAAVTDSVTSDDHVSVTLTAGELGSGYAFGEMSPATITGTVFEDQDNDGVKDAGEPGIAGVALDVTGPTTATGTSDASGNFSVGPLLPGTYALTETQPGSHADGMATPGAGATESSTDVLSGIVVTAGGSSSGNKFGELPGSLAGVVFDDTNGNGVQDGLEAGVVGAAVTLSGTESGTDTTDSTGAYNFPNLSAGSYTITETQPVGYDDGTDAAGPNGGTVGNDVVSSISLGPGVNAGGYTFGEAVAASISGAVYDDYDADGSQDPGEPGIQGITVTLSGPCSCTEVTASDGTFSFIGLAPGTYTLTETQSANYVDGGETAGNAGGNAAVNDVISAITISSGQTGTGYLFGEQSGSVTGVVFEDTDADGTHDGGEPGIDGVTVTVTGPGGPFSATTSGGGLYIVHGLRPGTYSVAETQPGTHADWIDTAGAAGGTATEPDTITGVTLVAGQDTTGYLFGEVQAQPLSGVVFRDIDSDGVLDGGEPGIDGVTLTVTGVDARFVGVSRTLTTSGGGLWSVLLAPGSYTVAESQPTGLVDWIDTAGTRGGTVTEPDTITGIAMTPGNFGTGYLFGEIDGARVSGTVALDDFDSTGVEGVTLTLAGIDDRGGSVNRTTITGPDGTFSVTGLAPGTYTLHEIQPGNLADGGETAGTGGGAVSDDTVTGIVIPTGASVTDYSFTEHRPTVTGSVFRDTNGDSLRQTCSGCDPGAGSVTVRLLAANGTLVQETQTAADGTYAFTEGDAGSFLVEFVPPTGYALVLADQGADDVDSDADPATGRVTLTITGDVGSVDAGIALAPVDLAVAMTQSTTKPTKGGPLDYAVTVSNTGATTANGPITSTQTMSNAVKITGVEAGAGWNCAVAGATVTCQRSDPLTSGQVAPVITIHTTVVDASLPITATVQVSAPGVEATPANNITNVSATPKSGGLPVTGADVAKLLTIAFGTVALGLFLERSPRRGRKRRDVQPDDGPDDQERES